ncbi:fungal-specific transcription factor domain-containing protein [Crepidotus variabilis]|uniref:Fungal-specific transcription factor domain-containing protein n=1 Tax=Crepidotus variabilis TaxID=179855 RepID=A0A9P6EKM7_9AGAR|nr:fungal-specific transcription factor domain-containing protein [Crepidotus variabilis]
MNSEDSNSPFMKGPKRKRLAKACDACHKSKRRCDGTAPCSNCYYASKSCTYTDASGRSVPAPRIFKPGAQDQPQSSSSTEFRNSNQSQFPPGASSNQFRINPVQQGGQYQNDDGPPRKRFRPEPANVPVDDLIIEGPLSGVSMDRPISIDLDPALTRELTNLFFTHCHPARAVVHKPTFSTALSHNRVPSHLLLAVCALAAPLSKQPRIRTSPSRFAGKPFAQEALSQMFDGAGRLVVEPDLAAAQALCLLQMHDILTKEKDAIWGSRFHDLALQIVEGLGVQSPEHPTLTPVPSPEFIQRSIEREAIRRIFWLIHVLDLLASVYFKKPVTFTDSELRLRLPVDETSFELGVHSTLPEYLYLPAVRMQYTSEFGHFIRILTIFSKMEYALDGLSDPKLSANPSATLNEAEQKMDEWDRTLPVHLRFSEESLQVQQSMFETSSNTGAWCWCMLHIYHASCALALNIARNRPGAASTRPNPQWAVERIELILQMLGDRAKHSILLGCALWSLIKYCKRDDTQIRKWASDYEDSWGTKMFEMVQDWRSQPSPPPMHPYPTNINLQQPPSISLSNGQSEMQLRRPSDVRNPTPQHAYGLALNNARPQLLPQHVMDAMPYSSSNSSSGSSNVSNNLKRSASHSPPMSYGSPSGRPPPSTSVNGTNGRSLGMHHQSNGNIAESPNASRGSGPMSLLGSNEIGPTSSYGGSGNDPSRGSMSKYGNGPRWHAGGGDASASAPAPGTQSSETPSSGYSGSSNGIIGGPGASELGRGSTESGGGGGGNNSNTVGLGVVNGSAAASGQRNLPPLSDGHSLPSLKDSGLLDSWSSSRNAGGLDMQKQLPNGAPSQQPQQSLTTSPRRTSPPVGPNIPLTLPSVPQHHVLHTRMQPDSTDLRQTSSLQAMPVGLPWLANESR